MILGLKWYDWLLIAVWILFLAVIGPWLISAPSTLAVVIGIVVIIFLAMGTAERISRL